MCDEFPGWAADDAIAATVYCYFSFYNDPDPHFFFLQLFSPLLPIILGVHTTGDSDSIASMTGALVGAKKGFGPGPKKPKGFVGPYKPTFDVMPVNELKRIKG